MWPIPGRDAVRNDVALETIIPIKAGRKKTNGGKVPKDWDQMVCERHLPDKFCRTDLSNFRRFLKLPDIAWYEVSE